MQVKFNWVEDDNGNEGFLFEGAPSHFDATPIDDNSIRLLCHDVLEHDIKKDSGSVVDELRAIGAACYGRGNYGTVSANGILNDIVSMARDSMLYLPHTNKGMKKFDDIEWILSDIDMNKLIHYISSEMNDYDIDRSTNEIKSFINLAFRYIRQGARKAQKNTVQAGIYITYLLQWNPT